MSGKNIRKRAGRRVVLLAAVLAPVLVVASVVATTIAPAVAAETARPVLVAGATGRTGVLVVKELKAAGYPVRALVRDAAAARGTLGEGVEIVEGDLRNAASLGPALSGVLAVISTVGSSGGAKRDPANGPEQLDYQGVANLAKAAAAAGASQIVLVSSAGVTREDHPLNKMFDNLLLWKAKGEAAVQASGVPFTIIRPGGLTGSAGGVTAIRLEQGDTGTGFIPRADVARLAVAALRSPAAKNRVFEAYSGNGPASDDWDALFGALKPPG